MKQKAASALKILSHTGITIIDFANKTGLNVGSLYTYTSSPERMSKIKAEYILWSIEKYYPTQFCFIKERETSLKI